MTPERQAVHPRSITVGYMSHTDRPHFLDYFTAVNKLMIGFGPVNLFLMGTEWSSISPEMFLDQPRSCGWVTFDRDSTNMADAVSEVSKLRRFWSSTRSLGYWPYRGFDDTFTEDRVLYNFYTDESRTGLAHKPTRVTSIDMMEYSFGRT